MLDKFQICEANANKLYCHISDKIISKKQQSNDNN